MMNFIRTFLNNFTISGIKRYSENTIWLVAEKMVRMVVMLVVGIYVANQLGDKIVGEYDYIVTILSLLVVVVDFGLDGIIVREIVKNPDKQGEILGSSFLIRLIGYAILLMGISTFIVIQNFTVLSLTMGILTAGYVCRTLWGLDSLFKAKVRAKYLSISTIIAILVFAVARVVTVNYTKSILWIAACEAMFEVVLVVGYFCFYRFGNIVKERWFCSRAMVFKLLHEAWPLAVSLAITVCYMRLDKIYVTNFLGDSANGCYSTAVKFVEVGYFLPMIICSSVFPAVINARKIDFKLYDFRLRLLFSTLIWSGLATAIVMIMISPFMIRLLLNPEFEPAIGVVQLMAINNVIVFFGIARGYWLLAEGLQRYNLLFMICGLVVNFVGNILILPHWGIQGAAVVSVATQVTANIIAPLLVKSTRCSTVMFFQAIIGYGIFKR